MIVLDTHAWIWWCSDPEKLSRRARRAIEQEPSIGIAAISCWELAMLVARGRLELDRDILLWVRQALDLPKLALLPLTPEVAVAAATLSEPFPGDPADRLIVATALLSRASLITKDRRVRSWKKVETVW